MRRRSFLAGVGTLAGVGGATLGTGAFTRVSAERAVSVAVARDYRAFLRLEPLVDEGLDGEPTRRSFTSGRIVEFELPGNGDGENGEGVGVDSTYEFHDLMRVENHGTQPVEVYSTYGGGEIADLALVRDSGILRDDPPILEVGEGLDVGLFVDTHGTDIREEAYDETLTIVADQPDE